MLVLWNVLGVVAGVVVGSVANLALLTLNMTVLFPAPPGMDGTDPAALEAYVAGLPAAALLVVVLAHNAQALIGGWVAARVGASAPVVLGLVIGGLTALGSAYNLATLPGPAWMWADVPLNLAAGYLGGALVAASRR